MILFCDDSSRIAEGHQRIRAKAFEGMPHLTSASRIGRDATLVLSVQSKLFDAIEAEIQFRLPDGTRPQSLALFK